MKILFRLFYIFSLLLLVQFSCKRETPVSRYNTKNVIVMIMDGPRYSETWGDPAHACIPRMAGVLAKQGVVYTHYYNNGPTYTLAGHTSITTGFYQEIENTGQELPQYPSMFQHWRQTYMTAPDLAWVIASKDKLEILGNCRDTLWKGHFLPSTNCGLNGAGTGSGYRSDSATYSMVIQILREYHPQLALINFAEPDLSAHGGNWSNYLKGIRSTDEYIYEIWNYLQTDSYYKGTTTVFVTNDHGRHLDSVSDGFINHGDGCEGCRHINLYACGPDFKQDMVTDENRDLIDLTATIAELLHFGLPGRNGKVMTELFKEQK